MKVVGASALGQDARDEHRVLCSCAPLRSRALPYYWGLTSTVALPVAEFAIRAITLSSVFAFFCLLALAFVSSLFCLRFLFRFSFFAFFFLFALSSSTVSFSSSLSFSCCLL